MNIADLSPKAVFYYFSQIASIPHGSGNTGQIADYCISFADEHNLKSYKDNAGNVMIFADGTRGYEKSAPVILQGHLDMVCDKKIGSDFNFETDSLKICTDGNYVWAEDTTLGGDDGIAIAYILAILDSKNIPHPPIEALFTVDEEIGMIGARELDTRYLKSKRLINLDSEVEGVLTTSCAGGVRAHCDIPLQFTNTDDDMVTIKIMLSGLKGGHSGVDINKHRKNALKIMGRLLEFLGEKSDILLADVSGGRKANAIPKSAQAVVCVNESDELTVLQSVMEFYNILKMELKTVEPEIKLTAEIIEKAEKVADKKSTRKLIFSLMQIPNGIQTMSPDIPDMVQTSLNLGIASIEKDVFMMSFLIRSNASTGKQTTIQKLNSFIDYLGGKVIFTSDYPAWEYRIVSELRDVMINTYNEVYADKPVVASIHAGLECGILSGKISGIDMISIGPNLENVHTPDERMNVASVERCWNYLLKVLKNLR